MDTTIIAAIISAVAAIIAAVIGARSVRRQKEPELPEDWQKPLPPLVDSRPPDPGHQDPAPGMPGRPVDSGSASGSDDERPPAPEPPADTQYADLSDSDRLAKLLSFAALEGTEEDVLTIRQNSGENA